MRTLLLLFATVMGLLSCKKEKDVKPQLPEATQIGANTFGCLIDGKVFVLNRKYTTSNPEGVYAVFYVDENRLNIGASQIDLNCKWTESTGTFEMAGQYPYKGYYWNLDDGTAITGSNEYMTDSVNKGAVTITYYDGKIISGTFWFNAANDAGQVVRITDGRFDITL